jgi:hypothetical protein
VFRQEEAKCLGILHAVLLGQDVNWSGHKIDIILIILHYR